VATSTRATLADGVLSYYCIPCTTPLFSALLDGTPEIDIVRKDYIHTYAHMCTVGQRASRGPIHVLACERTSTGSFSGGGFFFRIANPALRKMQIVHAKPEKKRRYVKRLGCENSVVTCGRDADQWQRERKREKRAKRAKRAAVRSDTLSGRDTHSIVGGPSP